VLGAGVEDFYIFKTKNVSSIISEAAIQRRAYWINEIRKLSGHFSNDTDRLEEALEQEVQSMGITALVDHLRLCGNIPESYGYDSSEEKLYSKYTDVLLSLAFKAIGLGSLVLKERTDSADVEAFAENFSLVADAKSFRLSRTAKNQKDFKIQAMDNWKRGKPYAFVVCPIHQLPNRASQIYQQATARNVCIFTYSHLAVLLAFSEAESTAKAQELLLQVFGTIPALNPSKSGIDYWLSVNRVMLGFSKKIENLWNVEKEAATQSIGIAKVEALTFLAEEREKIMRMSHEEALTELIKVHKIESRIKTIHAVGDNRLLTIK
jgi:hypothetical protein